MVKPIDKVNQPAIIFVMGGPGSGKGTQSKLLADKKKYHHISTGDLVRQLLQESNELIDPSIKMLKEKMAQGELLSDEMILELIVKEMEAHPQAPGFLLDGYPRTQDQLNLFEKKIRPCDKVIYLNVAESILKERLLSRSEKEHRLDDNEATITKRIKLYQEKTFPLIQFLEKSKGERFIRIDSEGKSIDEMSQLVEQAVDKQPVAQVNVLEFLLLYVRYGNFYDAVEQLEQRYHTSDFKVSLAWTTLFYVIQNKEDVKKILSVNAVTGYQNHNFDLSHGHELNINATQAFLPHPDTKKNPLWQSIHSALAQEAGSKGLITDLISKHIRPLFQKPTFQLDEAFEDFMLNFWCEYLFGDKVCPKQYKETRAKLLATLHYTFYDSRIRNVPYLGEQAVRLYRYLKRDEFAQIDAELNQYITQADAGLVSRFRDKLQKSDSFPQDKVNQAVLDNTFDLVFVFDFIHNAMYETLVEILKSELDDHAARKASYPTGLNNAYLFPFRTRVPQQDVQLNSVTISKGTTVYINLLKTGLHHSSGPRSCIGIGVTEWIKDAIWQHLEGMQLRIINTTYPESRKKASLSRDVPISKERYEVKWSYPREYLQKILAHYPFKGVESFYDVLKIYENPVITDFAVSSFLDEIEKLHLDQSKLCIVTTEVRGIPAAAMVAQILHVPLVIIRKPGKIPGEVITQEYSSAYAKDILELSARTDLKDKHVVFIDDGIASGGTTIASCHLIEKLGGCVQLVLGMINHTYKEKAAGLNDYKIHTLFDFSNGQVQPGKEKRAQPLPAVSPSAVYTGNIDTFFKPIPERVDPSVVIPEASDSHACATGT